MKNLKIFSRGKILIVCSNSLNVLGECETIYEIKDKKIEKVSRTNQTELISKFEKDEIEKV